MITSTVMSAGKWIDYTMSRNVRVVAQSKQVFRQFCRPTEDMGPHEGDTYNFPKLYDMTGYGEFVNEDDDIPEGDFTIGYGTVTVRELTRRITIKQYASLYSKLSTVDAAVLSLMNNFQKSLDRIVGRVYLGCDLVYVPTGTVASKTYNLSNTGTAGAAATRGMSLTDVQNIADEFEGMNIPPYEGEDYFCISSRRGMRGITRSSEYYDAVKYADPERNLVGEIGRVEKTRFLGENSALNNALTSLLGEMVFFGDDPVVEVEIIPMAIQAALEDQWGRVRSFRYLWNGGFGRTWTWSTDSQARILKVGTQ